MPSYTQYKWQLSVLDSSDEDITWITVKGNHIPIKKGQSKGDAVKEFFESKKSDRIKKDMGAKTRKPIKTFEMSDLYRKKAEKDFFEQEKEFNIAERLRESLQNKWEDYNKKINDDAKKMAKNRKGKFYSAKELFGRDFVINHGNMGGVERKEWGRNIVLPEDFIGLKTNKNDYPLDKIVDYEYEKYHGKFSELRASALRLLDSKKFGEFAQKQQDFESKHKELYRPLSRKKNYLEMMIQDGWLYQNKKFDILTDDGMAKPYGFTESVMKAVRVLLKKEGWIPYHSSGKRVASSSSYYEKDGETIRLSNHHLPDTPERLYNTEMGFRKGWDYEFVIDDDIATDLAIQPTKEQFDRLVLDMIFGN